MTNLAKFFNEPDSKGVMMLLCVFFTEHKYYVWYIQTVDNVERYISFYD